MLNKALELKTYFNYEFSLKPFYVSIYSHSTYILKNQSC